MRILITILFAFLFSSDSVGQNTFADSIKQSLKTATDSSRVTLLNDLAWQYVNSDPQTSIKYANEALQLGRELGFLSGQAKALTILGVLYTNKGQPDSGISYFNRSIEIRTRMNDKRGIAVGIHNIGEIYKMQGLSGKAIESFTKAARAFEASGDFIGVSYAMGNIASMYMSRKNYSQSTLFYEKALSAMRKNGDTVEISRMRHNLANSQLAENRKELALKNYMQALAVSERFEDKLYTAHNLIGIGDILSAEKKFEQSSENYKKALNIYEALDDKNSIATALLKLSENYFQLNSPSNSIELAEKALKISTGINSAENIKSAKEILARAYFASGRLAEAYRSLSEYSRMNDSLLSKESAKQVAEMSVQYETEKKEKEIQLLNKSKALQQTEIEKKNAEVSRQKTQRNALIAGFLMVLLLGGVLLKNYKQKKKANLLLEKQNHEIVFQKKIIEEKNKDITDSIKYAQRIQHAILPPIDQIARLPFSSFILYKPKDIVSGDFYFFTETEDSVFLAAVDCTGHGVPGAFMSIVGHNLLNQAVTEQRKIKPSEILDELNKGVSKTLRQQFEHATVKDGMDISLVNISREADENGNYHLQYAGANNPLWIIKKEANQIEAIPADKQPVGAFVGKEMKLFTNKEAFLKKGDLFYLFTDGYADQFGGEAGKKFKYTRMKQLLVSIKDLDLEKQKNVLEQTIETWKGPLEQVDDICVIGVRV